MERRLRIFSACAAFLLAVSSASPAIALDEDERLWMVGSKSFADALYPLAARALGRFATAYPNDARTPDAVFMLGKARLNIGDADGALEAFVRAQTFKPPPGGPLEAKLWEGEALLRLKRFGEARAAYDELLRTDVLSPLAPDALYGFGVAETELKHPEGAVAAFRDLVQTWPDHRLAPAAALSLASALVDLKRFNEALPILESFGANYPGNKLIPNAMYLQGWTRIQMGERRAAVADLRALIEKYPTHEQTPGARRLLNETLARFGDRDDLRENYEALVKQPAPTAEALYDAASLAGRLGRPKDQEAAWRKVVAEFPDHQLGRRAALDLAGLAFKRRDWKESATFARAAAEGDDEEIKGEGWLLAGEAGLKLKQFPAAVESFEAVVALPNAEAAVRYRAFAGLGLAREEQRDWKAALAAYEAAARAPDTTLRDWAQDRVTSVKSRIASEVPKPAPKEMPKDALKETPKDALKDPPKDTPKEPEKDALKETPRDTPAETPKDALKDTPTEAPKEALKEPPKEPVKEAPSTFKEPPKETVQEPPKEAPKTMPKTKTAPKPAPKAKPAVKPKPQT